MSEDEFLDRMLDLTSMHERTMVVGRVDTGKSTLVKNLADNMDACVLDADIGQNDIGPPSVISMGKRVNGQYRAIDGYFCGSTTPSRHFLQVIAGMSRLIQLCGSRRVLINTMGLATGAIGRALITEKINAIRPDLIIGLETADELKYLYAFAHAGSEVAIFRPHPMVTSRSRTQRAETRKAGFRSHFEGAGIKSYGLDEFSVERLLLNNGIKADLSTLQAIDPAIVHAETLGDEVLVVYDGKPGDTGKIADYLHIGTIHAFRPSDFSGALIGLLDASGKFLALGIIDSVDFKARTVNVFTATDRFSVMQFGSMKLDKTDFSHAGTFAPDILHP